jgi:hypothetical protein
MSAALALAALVYLGAYGARMPILALRGLLRVRNLVLIVTPALALGALTLLLAGRVDAPLASGALAVAVVPSPLVAPGVVARLRGRMDLAGALGLGTILVSLLVVGSRGALAAGALFVALEVYAIAAMVAGAIPPLRDLLLAPLRVIGWAAFAVALASGLVTAPPLGLVAVSVAFALLVAGVAAAWAAARLTGREPLAAVAGSGLRDPALAVALAAVTAGPDATGVPLIYALFCLGLAAAARAAR